LHFFDLSVLSSASMSPAYSIASTMGPMVAAAGSASPGALLGLCAIMLCMAVAFSQLSRVSPNAGSSYSWIRTAFGNVTGAYGAWLLLLSNFFATMATAVPAGDYTLALIAPAHADSPVWSAVVGAVWILASALLLYVGVRPTAAVTAVALAIELGVLAVTAVVAAMMPHAHVATHAGAHLPAIPLTLFGLVNAMTLAIWMSDGWEVSSSAAEEVDAGPRAAGRGGIAGLLVTTVVLVGCMAAYLHLGSPAGFAGHQADAMLYVGDLLGGGVWRWAIVVTVLVSTCSALWTTVLYLSRSVYAMGRDGLLPRRLGALDGRSEPLWALGTVAILVTACELLTGLSATAADQLTLVLNVSAIFLGLLFVLSALACVRRFWNVPGQVVAGVIVPLAGAACLLAILAATVWLEERQLRWYAIGGIMLGLPFAWIGGGAIGRYAARPPEHPATAP
jgi:amino acid transporter